MFLIGDVIEFGTNASTVSFSERVEQLSQTHSIATKEHVARVKNCFLVGIAETIENWVELRNGLALYAL